MTKVFDVNDRAAIQAALADPDPENEIAKAIALRTNALTEQLIGGITKGGELPEVIEFAKPVTALDDVVIALFEATVNDLHAVIADVFGTERSDIPPIPKIVIVDHGSQ